MPPQEQSSLVDITRWSRADRRKIKGARVPGRNLPYVKEIHGSLENFNTLRAQEKEQDANNTSKEIS